MRTTYIIALLLFIGSNLNAQSSNKNYVRTRTYTSHQGSSSTYLDGIEYFDGLGRPGQTHQKGVTPLGKDMVTLQEYDQYGRPSVTWLPLPRAGNGLYETDQDNLTDYMIDYYQEYGPFSRYDYEKSPLNRKIKHYSPGEDWHRKEKSVKTTFLTNNETSGDELMCCKFKAQAGGLFYKEGVYPANSLYVTKVEDEDNNYSFEFKDQSGKVILTRQKNGTENYDTYYIYDDYDNLIVVLPPLLADECSNYTSVRKQMNSTSSFQKYAYLYLYDHRNRCVGKKLPGCDWIYYIYDDVDRVIYTQDGEQRSGNYWVFNKYDAFGRLIISGIHYAGNKDKYMLEDECKNIVVEERHSNASSWFGYTNNTLPEIKENEILSVNFYDNYSRVTRLYPQLGWDKTQPSELYAGNGDFPANGLLVGKVEFFDRKKGYAKPTIYFYDQRQRVTQTRTNNRYNGMDTEFVNYNFTGQPIKRVLKHTAPDVGVGSDQLEIYNYTYDHAGRPVKTTHKLNSNAEVVLADNKYDELGRLSETKANNQNNLKVGYEYNIRSWTKKITNANFSQTLYYNETYKTNKPAYNGNISAIDWGKQRYILNYDNLSQLTSAHDILEISQSGINITSNFCYSAYYAYDKHGNMIGLQRNIDKVKISLIGGKIRYLPYTELLDNVDLEYTGNRLLAADNYASATNNLFKDYSANPVEYYFDRNGSMTQDHNRGVVNKYDLYNGMPKTTSVNNSQAKGVNEYIYTAGGEKLFVQYYTATNKLVTPGAGIELTVNENTFPDKTIAYISNRVYESGGLKRILIDNGYIENGIYYFYIKDHLGNNRVVMNASGAVVQETDYFPFGTPFPSSTNTGVQPYKFSDKEYDQMHGLDQYDFHARQMDGIRFTSPDPLAEKYYSWSPYVYCMNNPMRLIDPTGMIVRDPNGIYKEHKKAINSNIKEIKAYSEVEGLSKEMISALTNLMNGLTEILDEYSGLEKSDVTYNIMGGEESITYYSDNAVQVQIGVGATFGEVGHELKHAYQYEKNKISFSVNGYGTLYDITDEVETYNRDKLINVGVSYYLEPSKHVWKASDVIKFGKSKGWYQNLPKGPTDIHSIEGIILRIKTQGKGLMNQPILEIYKDANKDYQKGVNLRNKK